MEDLEEGKMYVVTLKTSFVYPFSHYEDLPNDQRVAYFETPGEGRHGKQYRKVVIGAENVVSIRPVE